MCLGSLAGNSEELAMFYFLICSCEYTGVDLIFLIYINLLHSSIGMMYFTKYFSNTFNKKTTHTKHLLCDRHCDKHVK